MTLPEQGYRPKASNNYDTSVLVQNIFKAELKRIHVKVVIKSHISTIKCSGRMWSIWGIKLQGAILKKILFDGVLT